MYILVYIPCVVLVTVNDIHGHSSQQNTKPNASGRTLGTATTATTRYHKHLKTYAKYYSITTVLLDLILPSFNTVIHNFVMHMEQLNFYTN